MAPRSLEPHDAAVGSHLAESASEPPVGPDLVETEPDAATTAAAEFTQQALAEVRQGRADWQAELEEMKLARTLPAPQEYAIAAELKKQIPFIAVVRPSERTFLRQGSRRIARPRPRARPARRVASTRVRSGCSSRGSPRRSTDDPDPVDAGCGYSARQASMTSRYTASSRSKFLSHGSQRTPRLHRPASGSGSSAPHSAHAPSSSSSGSASTPAKHRAAFGR